MRTPQTSKMELFAKITIGFKPLTSFGKSSIWYIWQVLKPSLKKNWDLKLLILVVISLSVKPRPFSAIFNNFPNVKNIFWLCFHKNVLPEVANEQAANRRCSWEKDAPIPKGKIPEKHLWRNSFFSKLAGILQDFDLRFIWLLLRTLSHHRNCYQPMGWTQKRSC